jgi:hypothetical protein
METYKFAREPQLLKLPAGRGRGPSPGHSVKQMLREIQTLRFAQAPFGRIFWLLEQRISHVADEIERRRT